MTWNYLEDRASTIRVDRSMAGMRMRIYDTGNKNAWLTTIDTVDLEDWR